MNDYEKKIIQDRLPSVIAALLLSIVMLSCANDIQIKNNLPPQKTTKKECTQPAEQKSIDSLKCINHEINALRHDIDSLHRTVQQRANAEMEQHPTFQYIEQNRDYIEKLKSINNKLLRDSYQLASKQSPLEMPTRGPAVFKQYENVPAIKRNGKIYAANNKAIKEFEKHAAELEKLQVDSYNRTAQNTTHTVFIMQNKMDSLLNVKDRIISQKSR